VSGPPFFVLFLSWKLQVFCRQLQVFIEEKTSRAQSNQIKSFVAPPPASLALARLMQLDYPNKQQAGLQVFDSFTLNI